MKLLQRKNTHQAKRRGGIIPYDVFEQHIGLVGLGNAGKTVFLTSLIDHIRLDGFKGRHNVSLTNFKAHETAGGDVKPFCYKLFRELIANECSWPPKTGEMLHYGFDFRRSDWKIPVRIHFYDIPGERIADASMFDRGFRDWSQHTLTCLSENRTAAKNIGAYTKFCEASENDAEAIAHRYKLLLGGLLTEYSALITPSTFLLDMEGKTPEDETAENCSSNRWVGLGKGREFAPLPDSVFKDRPELVKQYEAAYKDYRKNVVKPIFGRLSKCQQLLILADIPGLLCASTYRFNDAVALIEDMLKSLKPRYPKWKKIPDWFLPHRFCLSGIKRLALVATKSDMIRRSETDLLKSLVKEMAGRQLNDLRTYGVQTDIFTCAAVRCTDKSERPECLRGYPIFSEEGVFLPVPVQEGARMTEYPVDSLPSTWPRNWKPEDYSFPDVYPLMPVNFGKAPDQEGLWDILSFICGGGGRDDS